MQFAFQKYCAHLAVYLRQTVTLLALTCLFSPSFALSADPVPSPSAEQNLRKVSPQQLYVSCFLLLNKSRIEGDPTMKANDKGSPFVPHGPTTCFMLQVYVLSVANDEVPGLKLPFEICIPEQKYELDNLARSYLGYFERNAYRYSKEKTSGFSALALSMVEQYPCR